LPCIPHLLPVFLRLFHRGCVVSVSTATPYLKLFALPNIPPRYFRQLTHAPPFPAVPPLTDTPYCCMQPYLCLPYHDIGKIPPLQGNANNPGIFALGEIFLCRESRIYCYIGFLPCIPHLLLVFLRLFHRGYVVSVSRSQSPACVPGHEVVEGGRHAVPTPADSGVCFSCKPNGRFPALLRPRCSIAT
jgi:hypothetical protein